MCGRVDAHDRLWRRARPRAGFFFGSRAFVSYFLGFRTLSSPHEVAPGYWARLGCCLHLASAGRLAETKAVDLPEGRRDRNDPVVTIWIGLPPFDGISRDKHVNAKPIPVRRTKEEQAA